MERIKVRTVAGALLLVAGSVMGQPWLRTPLGDLGGQLGAKARGLNDLDEVVGSSDSSSGFEHAFYWSAATGMVDLPLLQGGHYGHARAINNLSQIVGGADDESSQERAVMWTRSGGVWQITDLNTLPGGSSATANAISDTGYIVGRSGTSAGPSHAFLYHDGAMMDLGVLSYPPSSGSSEALGVNASGLAVGYAYAPLAGPDHAWRWDGSTQINITPTGQFVFAHAVAINALGQIAGIGVVPGGGSSGQESAIYTVAGGWSELGVVPGYPTNEALAINNGGQVVGRMISAATQTNVAYFYGAGGMSLLSEHTGFGSELTEGTGISNTSGIVANAIDDLGISHTYLLRPDPCYVNCDRSTAAPVLNVNDFQCFLNLFAVQDPRANCDLSVVPPVLNTNDFQCFLNYFAAGCT